MPPIQGELRRKFAIDQPWHYAKDWGHNEHTAGSPNTTLRRYLLSVYPASRPSDPRPLAKAVHSRGEQWRVHNAVEKSDIQATGGYHQDEQEVLSTPTDLTDALQELAEAPADAEEDRLEEPSDVALLNAERLLKAMYRISPRRFVVYPVSDGRIAIDARGTNDRIMVVTCGSNGDVLCLVTINGEYRRARYSTARELPDGFIREALTALREK